VVHKYALGEAPGAAAVQEPCDHIIHAVIRGEARRGCHLPADRRTAPYAHVCVQPVLQALLRVQNSGRGSRQQAGRTAFLAIRTHGHNWQPSKHRLRVRASLVC
jgi:hypothetical protein